MSHTMTSKIVPCFLCDKPTDNNKCCDVCNMKYDYHRDRDCYTLREAEPLLNLIPIKKLNDPEVETNTNAMFQQLGFCHTLEHYRDNFIYHNDNSQENMDSLRKLINEVDNYYCSDVLTEFDKWYTEE